MTAWLLGVAGPVPLARSFVNDIMSEFGASAEFLHADIIAFLNQYSPKGPGREQMGAVVLARFGRSTGHYVIGTECPEVFASKHFGKVIAIGTGSRSIVEQVQSLDKYRYGRNVPKYDDEDFPEFETLARNVTLIANLYWSEFIVGDNLFNSWGGAYDLIYWDNGKAFRHLKEYTIFLRQYDHGHPDQGISLINVLKYERRPDVSLMCMLHDEQLTFFGAKDITASDQPLDVSVGGPNFTMNSRVHISIIQVGKDGIFVPPIIQIDGLGERQQTKQTVFTDFDEERRLRVFFNQKHDEWLTQQVKDHYQEYSDRIERARRFIPHV